MLRSAVKISLIIGMCAVAGGASAKTLKENTGPAELPPSSFKGNLFVDSEGCVFMRAGFGANVTWVPRVTRSRDIVCGQKPTFGKPKAVAVAAAPAPAPTPTAIVAAPVSAPKPVAKPKVVRKVVVAAPKPAPVAQPVIVSRPTTTIQRPIAAPTRRVANGRCPNLSATAQKYINTTGDVRCGSQAWHPNQEGRYVTTTTVEGPSPTYETATYQAPSPTEYGRVFNRVDRPVSGGGIFTGVVADGRLPAGAKESDVSREGTYQAVQPPEGYRETWDDGRLNPTRGIRGVNYTVRGQEGTYPAPRYDANGRYVPYPHFSKTVGTTAPAVEQPRARVVTAPRPVEPVASVRVKRPTATLAPTQVRVGKGHTYVQVGRFTSEASAQGAIARLQRTGLPTKKAIRNRNGETTVLVLAGPFGTPQNLGRALIKARNAGFPNATTR